MNATTPAQLSDTSNAQAASGSSFYAAMRILPAEQRLAMYEIYGFCRKVDDVADGTAPAMAKHQELAAWREAIDACYGASPPPRLSGLVAQIRRFDLAREDFHAVIDGMQMDVDENVVAPTWAALDLYCDRVASAVGRLSVRVFGLAHDSGAALAHHLGRALQLTNIVRDVDEDAAIGRLYLPREELELRGIAIDDARRAVEDPALASVCMVVATRSQGHFAEARRIMDRVPRAKVRAPRLMAAAYGDLLLRMMRRGFLPPRPRLKHSKLRLAGALLTYGLL